MGQAQSSAGEVECVAGYVQPVTTTHTASGPRVGAGEQGLIAEHLLEVGDVPLTVDAVAGEAAVEVVVEAAAHHGVEGHGDRVARGLVGVFAQGVDEIGPWKLRRAGKPTSWVEGRE